MISPRTQPALYQVGRLAQLGILQSNLCVQPALHSISGLVSRAATVIASFCASFCKLHSLLRNHPTVEDHYWRKYPTILSLSVLDDHWAGTQPARKPTYFTVWTSAKNMSLWSEWLHQSGCAPSEPWETPQWQITSRPAPIPRIMLHITLRSQSRRFSSLCQYHIVNEHSVIIRRTGFIGYISKM